MSDYNYNICTVCGFQESECECPEEGDKDLF